MLLTYSTMSLLKSMATTYFRATCYSGIPRFYSTENSVENSRHSALGSSSFPEVAKSPRYVDKTPFIEAILRCEAKNILITAPRRFGKSLNLDMLKCFFGSTEYHELFRSLKIGNNASVMKYEGQYPIIWLNFSDGVEEICSLNDAVDACRTSVQNAFIEHEYLIDSSKLNKYEKRHCELWFHEAESLNRQSVLLGLRSLAKYLYKHNGKKSMLLIDEFDAICSAAFAEVDAQVLNKIITFYSSLVGKVLKSSTSLVERSVLTGITRIMCSGLSNPINNVVSYSFLESSEFAEYYGITEEFSELMARESNSDVRHLKDEAFSFYNGYRVGGMKILNIWSVMNFLAKKEVLCYWVDSGIIELRLENICRNEAVRDVVNELVVDNAVKIDVKEFNARSFKRFHEDCSQPENKLINYSPLLLFYSQQGYLTVCDRSFRRMSMKVPNQEIKSVFVNALIVYFSEILGVKLELILDSVEYLQKLKVQNATESECHEILAIVAKKYRSMCNRGIYCENINEATFRDLMFTILYAAGFQPVSEERVLQDGYSYKKSDLWARIEPNAGVVIEFKVDQKNGRIALQQILANSYIEVLSKRNIANYLLLGINLRKSEDKNREHSLSFCYLRNTKDIGDMVEILL